MCGPYLKPSWIIWQRNGGGLSEPGAPVCNTQQRKVFLRAFQDTHCGRFKVIVFFHRTRSFYVSSLPSFSTPAECFSWVGIDMIALLYVMNLKNEHLGTYFLHIAVWYFISWKVYESFWESKFSWTQSYRRCQFSWIYMLAGLGLYF